MVGNKTNGSSRRLSTLVKILWIGSMLLALIGCRPEEEVTVSWMVFGDPAEVAAFESVAAAFEEAHPEIHVELGYIPDQGDYRRRLATDFTAGSPPDVMLLNYRRFATFAAQGGLEPLGSYLEESDLLDATEFYAPTIESFYYADELWCIPQNVSSLVVYVNLDLFDAAGVPYPENGWTQEEFLDAARALTQDLDGDGQIDQYGAGISPSLFRLAPFIWQAGGDLVDDPENPTRLTLDDPASLEAFQWFVDLQVSEHVAPDAVAEAAESGESRFLNGRLGMYFNSRRGVPTYRTITGFEWDVAPLPHGRHTAGILHSDGYCMAASAEHKEAAWTLIEFANSFEGQTLVAASGRTVPSLRAVAESEAFLAPSAPPAHSRVYLDTIPTLGRVPTMDTWSAIEETVSREIERAFYGQATVAEAAASADELSRPYFERQGRGDATVEP